MFRTVYFNAEARRTRRFAKGVLMSRTWEPQNGILGEKKGGTRFVVPPLGGLRIKPQAEYNIKT